MTVIEFPGSKWPTHEETVKAIGDAHALAEAYIADHE
jgi:hypothetical protein